MDLNQDVIKNPLHVAIVLPFLNEQALLANTCYSLGFGVGAALTPQNTTLILVDNGSTDESARIAEQIRSESAQASVILGSESRRGYVPARHRGVLLIRSELSANKPQDRLLIVQADADTCYEPGYLAAMQLGAEIAGSNVLLEGRTAYPQEFIDLHSSYVELCQQVDDMVERWFVAFKDDVIVDDKVAAFRLSDYFAWEGHQPEYAFGNDEVYAETSRLYLRAKAREAIRTQVATATAAPSMRRLVMEPALHFATAGFPREDTWNDWWRRSYSGPQTLVEFYGNTSHREVQRAIRIRRMHLLALFAILPLHVGRSLKNGVDGVAEFAHLVLPILPTRTREEMQRSPGIFLTDVFELIRSHGDRLLEELEIA